MARVKEIKYYGVHACKELAERRPEAIFRVYLDSSNVKTFSPLLKWCANRKIPYRILPTQELDRVSGSVHHEGICIAAKELKSLSQEEFLSKLKSLPNSTCLLYLDGVENPHNIGSILRSAAHFGIPYLLGTELPSLSPSSCRIAKGAAEIVRLVSLSKPLPFFSLLRDAGFSLFGTSSHRGNSLYKTQFPSRTILAIGSESKGLQPEILKIAASSIQIPGTGAMESLNVSVAAGLCMGAYCQQHRR